MTQPPPLPTFSPIRAITNNAVAARLWFCVAAGLAVWLFVQPYLIISAYRQKERVVVVDGAGSVIYSPLLNFSEAGDLQAYHVRLACLALLQRHPQGSDFPDLLEREFIEPARSEARRIITAQAADFIDRQIHQKVEIAQIQVLETTTVDGHEGFLCEASGQLIRTGKANGLAFVEPVPFELRLLLLRNPDLTTNDKLPLVVHQIAYKEN